MPDDAPAEATAVAQPKAAPAAHDGPAPETVEDAPPGRLLGACLYYNSCGNLWKPNSQEILVRRKVWKSPKKF